MNCFMCKGNLEKKKVNYIVVLEDTIIIIKGVPVPGLALETPLASCPGQDHHGTA